MRARIDPKTTSHSRELRTTPADAECLPWRDVRARQLRGGKIRHQHPVHEYVVDVGCLEAMVELDRGQHTAVRPEGAAG